MTVVDGRKRRAQLRRVGTWLGPGLLRASRHVIRVRTLHEDHVAKALKTHAAVIYAFWHGRMWLIASRLYPLRLGVLVSLSEDGELIAQVLQRLGQHPVRGSSSRRGREGLRELEDLLQGGRSVALTPDGPRGPRHRAQMGTVALAARTGKPIVPLSSAARRSWTLRSWDAFQIPRPGTRGVIVYGRPLQVPPRGELEPWRIALEEALNRVENEADQEVFR